MTDAQLVLHIGAPKCGSSALQTALTMTPELCSADGQRFRYTAAYPLSGRVISVTGNRVSRLGKGSAYGYASWPNLGPKVTPEALFRALNRVRRSGLRRGYVPVVSNEGWISHHAAFAKVLAEWGHPPVDVVAYLRPPVEWVNAAYWQWGIWHAPNLDAWLQRGKLHFSFGEDLEAWSKIPGVRLHAGRSRPDVVRRFCDTYDVGLPKVAARNSSLPPSLVGVLLRTPRLRPSGHASAVEFVFQRWCPPVPGRRLWAVRARHVHFMREAVERNWAALQRCLSEAELQDLMQDPRWLQEKPYHAAINAGESPLDDRAEYAGLYAALRDGIGAVALAAGRPVPVLPACPQETAPLDDWDAVLVPMLDRLTALDREVRRKTHFGSLFGWPRSTA